MIEDFIKIEDIVKEYLQPEKQAEILKQIYDALTKEFNIGKKDIQAMPIPPEYIKTCLEQINTNLRTLYIDEQKKRQRAVSANPQTNDEYQTKDFRVELRDSKHKTYDEKERIKSWGLGFHFDKKFGCWCSELDNSQIKELYNLCPNIEIEFDVKKVPL